MQRFRLSLIAGMLLVMFGLVPAASAEDARCFAETSRCFSGRFETYWNRNGDLPVFGLPLTTTASELNRDAGKYYRTQWFERNRFEIHPENAAPYDVLLGRLGDDRLRQLGVNWRSRPRESGPKTGCLWFAETGRNVCNQSGSTGFASYWQAHGLQDPRLDAYGRSLALFGLPLTDARMEKNASGDNVLTQWFERARFEWHPSNPADFKVLLGLLGTELRADVDRVDKRVATRPMRLLIPSISMDAPLMGIGLDESRRPIVPRHDVAWYADSAVPGEGSNVILWGHVLRFQATPNIPAPFARVSELKLGAELTLVSADNKRRRYRVTQQVQVKPNALDYLRPTTSERITLVSCIGERVVNNGVVSLDKRLITIAEPIR